MQHFGVQSSFSCFSFVLNTGCCGLQRSRRVRAPQVYVWCCVVPGCLCRRTARSLCRHQSGFGASAVLFTHLLAATSARIWRGVFQVALWWCQPCGRPWTERFFWMIFLPSLWFGSVRREARTFRRPPLWDMQLHAPFCYPR